MWPPGRGGVAGRARADGRQEAQRPRRLLRYLELPWAASHPRSYAEWLPAELRTENTTRAFALLQSALLQVYEQNLFRSVMVVTSGKRSVLRLVPAEHRAMVKAELARALNKKKINLFFKKSVKYKRRQEFN